MKTKRILFVLSSCIIVMMMVLNSSCKQSRVSVGTTPDAVYEKLVSNPSLNKPSTGETFCWRARSGMNQFVDYFQLTNDTKWLEAGIKYYDFLLGRREVDPEGYKGWIGPYMYDAKYWQDALVGDAVVLAGILDFSVLVMENEQLKAKYGEKAMSYVETAKKDLVEKWDKRGCWYTDPPFGGYINYNKYFMPGNIKEWVYDPDVRNAGVSHPFNKQMDVAEVCLRIHKITGEKKYWDIAETIYFTAKNRFQYFDDHYCWNYWEPLYPGDVIFEKNNTRHWVGVHIWRSGYQAGEVGKIVEAYHHGIVFDSVDIQRIINTNLNVMWNKNKERPEFINSNGFGADHDTTGKASFVAGNGHSNEFKNQGQLWSGLLDFNQTIRGLYEMRFRDDKTSPEYLSYKRQVLANPTSFERKFAKESVNVPEINYTECRDLYSAAVLPHIVPRAGESILICKSWNPGDLQIDLFSTDGNKITSLFNGNIKEGFFMIKWDGKDPAKKATFKGDYKIRWTINGGYREFPVVIN